MARRLRHQQDVVRQIADKFPTYKDHFDEAVIQKTKQELRILEAKAHTGSLLEKVDRTELRAAILLECFVRETTGFRLPYKDLAKGMGIKKEKFEKLHNMIDNLRRKPQTSSRPNKNRRIKQSTSTGNRPTALQLSNVQNPESSEAASTIPRLSLRLNSLVQDPHGFSLKAEKLMKDISIYVDTLTRSAKRRGEREEIDCHKSAYEAACFFYVVNAAQPKTTTRSKQQQSIAKQINADEYGNRSLELEDILNACPELTEMQFKHILKHLGQLAAEVKDFNAQSNVEKVLAKAAVKGGTASKKSGAKKLDSKKRKCPSAKDGDAGSKTKKSRESATDLLDDEVNQTENAAANTKHTTHSRPIDEPETQSLHEWRQQTLADAKTSAKQEIHADTEKSLQEISDSEALQYAADHILRKFGVEIPTQ